MSGRALKEQKDRDKIKSLLNEMPDYVKDYYYQWIDVGCAPTTALDYLRKIRGYLKWMSPDLYSINISDTLNYPVRYIAAKRDEGSGKSISYLQTLHAALKSFYDYLAENKLVEYCPLNNRNRPQGQDIVERPAISKKSVKQILQSVDSGTGSHRQKAFEAKWKPRDKLIISILISTGMRRQALCNLDISDIRIREGKISMEGKDKRGKIFYWDATGLKDQLYTWLRLRKEILNGRKEDALFISSHKARISSDAVANIVRKYTGCLTGKGEGGYGPHTLRSGFISIAYDETKDIDLVAKAVHHSSINTTRRYIRRDNNPQEITSKILAECIEG